jgi:hypothetical protein
MGWLGKKDNHSVAHGRGIPSMCDYSLHLVASRPAKAGDKLETTSFCGTTTRGFAAVGEPNVAVCLLPGTEVAFDKAVEYYRIIGTGKVEEKTARFRQVNSDRSNVNHDALEFPGGRTVLLTRLCEGQRATVLQLPATPRVKTETEERVSVAPSWAS